MACRFGRAEVTDEQHDGYRPGGSSRTQFTVDVGTTRQGELDIEHDQVRHELGNFRQRIGAIIGRENQVVGANQGLAVCDPRGGVGLGNEHDAWRSLVQHDPGLRLSARKLPRDVDQVSSTMRMRGANLLFAIAIRDGSVASPDLDVGTRLYRLRSPSLSGTSVSNVKAVALAGLIDEKGSANNVEPTAKMSNCALLA